MSKKMVNALKAKVKKLKYTGLTATAIKPNGWNEINSGHTTYKDLNREPGLAINGQKITNEFINNLYSKHENLILQDKNGEKNYRPFLKKVFTEMFKSADATVPNDSIIEELITNYNQGGYTYFLPYNMSKALVPFHLLMLDSYITREYIMDCHEPNCIKLSFSMKYTKMFNHDDHTCIKTPGFCSLVEFKLKCKDGNVTYEDGKVLLTIPKELKNYKVNDKNLFDIIVEYFQKICEKLGFKFETKIEHSLGKPLKVVSEANASSVEDLKLKVNNPR